MTDQERLDRAAEILAHGLERVDIAEGLIPPGHVGFFGAIRHIGITEEEAEWMSAAGLLDPIDSVTFNGLHVWPLASLDALKAQATAARDRRRQERAAARRRR